MFMKNFFLRLAGNSDSPGAQTSRPLFEIKS